MIDETAGQHTSHCCARHGCKYAEDDCPVVLNELTQEYPCEVCDTDEAFGEENYFLHGGAGGGDEEGFVAPEVLATQTVEFQIQYAVRKAYQEAEAICDALSNNTGSAAARDLLRTASDAIAAKRYGISEDTSVQNEMLASLRCATDTMLSNAGVTIGIDRAPAEPTMPNVCTTCEMTREYYNKTNYKCYHGSAHSWPED